MFLSLGTLDVFTLPEGTSPNTLNNARDNQENPAEGLKNEHIIKVCVTLCNKYLLILTKRTLYVYSNGHNIMFLGNFTLDEAQLKSYGGFRDITILNGIYQICLLVENLKRVLICRYDTNTSLGYDFTLSHMNTPKHNYPNVSSESVLCNSYASPGSPKVTLQQAPGPSDEAHTVNSEFDHVYCLFSNYLPSFLNITLSFELVLPSFVSVVSCIDYQLFFWTLDQSGVYATICPDGFLNYILTYPLLQFKRISLYLHSTNILQNLNVCGSVDASHGLCYLNLTSQLYIMNCNEVDTSELCVDLYASEDKNCNRPVSLMDWVLSCASKVNSEPNHDEDTHSCSDGSNDFENTLLDADSILSCLEERNTDSFYDDYDNCIQNILPYTNAKQVEFMESCDLCYIVTTSNALLSFFVCNKNPVSRRIGRVLYKDGVESISVNIHRNMIAIKLINGNVMIYYSSEYKFTAIGDINISGINDYCWIDDHLVILYENSELSYHHFTGRMIYNKKLHKPIKSGHLYAVSANFRLMITEGLMFSTYTLHNSGICHCKFANPNDSKICLIGTDHIFLVSSNVLDGCYGYFERKEIDDSLHSKSGCVDSNTIGTVGNNLTSIPFSCRDELFSNRTPFLYASCSPKGEYILAATNEGFALYDNNWTYFGECLGVFINLGWFANNIFFVTVMLHSDNYMQESNESRGNVGYFCHFFDVNDLSKQLEIIPFKYKPLCCTIENSSILTVYDVSDTITGYNIYLEKPRMSFDIAFQESLEPMEYDVAEIYPFGDKKYLFLDSIGNLYIVDNGSIEYITNRCINVTPFSSISGTGFDYLCHISPDQTYYLSGNHSCRFPAKLDNVVAVSGGIVVSLMNSIDGKNTFRGVKFIENIVSEHITHLGLSRIHQIEPFNIYLLDQFVSSRIYNSDGFSDAQFLSTLLSTPNDIKSQLFAILVRKEHTKDAVIKLESLFGKSSNDFFEKLMIAKQFRVASLMLLPLQLLTDPMIVRRTYGLSIIKGLIRKVAESEIKSKSDISLLNSLLRFQNMLSDDSTHSDPELEDSKIYNPRLLDNANIKFKRPVDLEEFEIPQLFLNYIRENNLVPIYKLSSVLNLDLVAFIEQIKDNILEITGWGICTPDGTCQDSKDLRLTELVVAYSTKLDTLDPVNIGGPNPRGKKKSSKKNRLPKIYPGGGIHELFFRVFSKLEIYIPALAIALASHNFLAITHILVKDTGIVNIVNHILSGESCENCRRDHTLIKHTIEETKRKFKL
ncbi:conserved hypothetical protein [Theileria equi strain WA]|uniref:Uncharacterized protein n=1 Tax=Theileria equi strain WA TaxID=1537102 RepID=L1LCL1_THEEQ|nr:conserved hypothetical protein [Theileria equi strain WA]EKX72898.1 conserved hypothetical protein [Theileria equi strain WA]|eukprot:XP_004832350.1 conserved hypothetical protein [Theileria equi strain WA]